MNTTRTTLTALAGLATVAALLTGCGSAGTGAGDGPSIPAQQWTPGASAPSGSDPTRTPPAAAAALPGDIAAGLDREDPDAVATTALTIWFTWNTAVDAGPNDAAARTAPLLTADYAREITSTTAQSSPGAQWMSWAAEGAVLVPDIVVDDEPTPPQTEDVAYRAYRITQRIGGTPASESIFAVIARRGPGGWEVSRIHNK